MNGWCEWTVVAGQRYAIATQQHPPVGRFRPAASSITSNLESKVTNSIGGLEPGDFSPARYREAVPRGYHARIWPGPGHRTSFSGHLESRAELPLRRSAALRARFFRGGQYFTRNSQLSAEVIAKKAPGFHSPQPNTPERNLQSRG
jgi:hypothetical protein